MIEPHKTAIKRKKPSRPVLNLVAQNFVTGRVLDYGCGQGKDVDYLRNLGFDVTGYDTYYAPQCYTGLFDTIMCNFVLNVVPAVDARVNIIDVMFNTLKVGGRLFISTRNVADIKQASVKWEIYRDGFKTNRNTFQKGIDATEIVEYFNQAYFANHGTIQVMNTVGYASVVITRTKL